MHIIRTVFAGTPEFAVPSLEALVARGDIDVVAVYTQPDRPAGRGHQVVASPIKQAAQSAGIAVHQPAHLADDKVIHDFLGHAAELLVVAAYGLMLPAPFIQPPVTPLNVHASLLPRWRGAAPIQRALMSGDRETGISIMRIVRRLDAGPVWLTRSCAIDPEDTAGTLHDKLARLGAHALNDALDAMQAGTIREQAQDEAMATYAKKITSRDRVIDWSNSARDIASRIRALNPAPGATTHLGEIEVKLLAAQVDDAPIDGTPGAVIHRERSAISFATGSGVLRVTELQPAGKQRMTAAAFLNGYGARF